MKQQLRNKIRQFNKLSQAIKEIPQVADKVVSDNADILKSLNRDQMLLGRNTDGELFSPTYQQDPYFKTKDQADWYAGMKYRLEGEHRSFIWNPVYLYPEKPKNVPNLIVTGSFHDHMFITTGNGQYTIESTYVESKDIEKKYNNKVFGLAPKSKEYFWQEYLRKELLKHLGL